MLVLSRKVGQKLILGDGIVVTVLEATGTRVRLGIEAPPDVKIMREELVLTGNADHPVYQSRLLVEHVA